MPTSVVALRIAMNVSRGRYMDGTTGRHVKRRSWQNGAELSDALHNSGV